MDRAESATAGKFDDMHYPAYSMGAAAEILGVTASFLRGLGEAGLVAPHRSDGGHRRYSRHQLELAARARELVNEGMTLAAACRVVGMEDQLDVARQRIVQLEDATAHETDGPRRPNITPVPDGEPPATQDQ